MNKTVVCAFYKFVALKDCQSLQKKLLSALKANHLKGTILLAREGINGTISGSRKDMDRFLTSLKADRRFGDLVTKESTNNNQPFYRTKVKVKKEIVTMGKKSIDPRKIVGTYVRPKDWNKLIAKPDVTLIDTRNDYEVGIGTFKNAQNPKTKTFREFPSFVKKTLAPFKNKKIATFCTGGIRCEKATAYLRQQGFKKVYHLEGGILKYLEVIPKKKSLWKGECFVFDNRVAVNHSLKKGSYDQCHACRMPLSKKDKKKKCYVKGVSCPYCHRKTSAVKKRSLKEREKQMALALKRGTQHLGSPESSSRKCLSAEKR